MYLKCNDNKLKNETKIMIISKESRIRIFEVMRMKVKHNINTNNVIYNEKLIKMILIY